jgi:hypothetical protein
MAHYAKNIVAIDLRASRAGFVPLHSAWHPWRRAPVRG